MPSGGPERREQALRAANRARGLPRTSGFWSRRARRRPPPAHPHRQRRGWLRIAAAAVALYLILRLFVVEAFRIPSASMERTLLVGDLLLVNKVAFGATVPFTAQRLPALRAPQRGDVIVFAWPVDPSKPFVKRLVGLPGDTLAMHGGALVRNGTPVREPYIYRSSPLPAAAPAALAASATVASANGPAGLPRDEWGPLIVPPHQYFVLGDNRDDSLDSRYWGYVPSDALIGTPWFVYFSVSPDSLSAFPRPAQIRWQRIGTLVR